MGETLTKNKINTEKLYKNFSRISLSEISNLVRIIQQNPAVVLGAAGLMGKGIGVTLNQAGILTLRNDINKELLEKAAGEALEIHKKAFKVRKLSKKQLETIKEKNLIGPSFVFPENNKIPYLENVSDKKNYVLDFLSNLFKENPELRKNFASSMFFIEAGPEILTFKQNIFDFFSYALNENALITTNTSSLKVDDIASKITNKERVAGFHYFTPAERHPLIEIICTRDTSLETLLTLRELAVSMGKKPIIAWKDSPGAIANRILVGILNEASRIADEGADPELVDKVFLATFYNKQIKVKLKSAKRQFEAAPKLGFFKDEVALYKKIKRSEKKALIEEAIGRLNQKVLYATILENHSELGSFFTPPKIVHEIKTKAKEQINNLRQQLSNLERPFNVIPYKFPKPSGNKKFTEKEIKERLQAAYITIAQEIFLEGLGTIHDIELACKQGFYWNVGPFELIKQIGNNRCIELSKIANKNLDQSKVTGISKPGFVANIKDEDISGVQTYIQDNIGYIVLGRLHIQYLQQMQNSLSIEMLKGIQSAIKDFEVNPDVKSIFITSQGGGPFSTGADLAYVSSIKWDIQKTREYVDYGYKVIMNDIAKCTKPTCAIVDGLAIGGGAELVCACDYRFGTYNSGFAFPEVNLVHIYPAWGGTETFPRIVGNKLAHAIMVPPLKKGLVVLSAEDAYEVGFLDKLVLQSEITHLKADLIQGKIPVIDIYKKPQRKANNKKEDYSENIIKKYHLNKLKKPRFRITSSFAANLTRKLIYNPEYVPSEAELKMVLFSGLLNSKLFIEPKIWLATSPFAQFLG